MDFLNVLQIHKHPFLCRCLWQALGLPVGVKFYSSRMGKCHRWQLIFHDQPWPGDRKAYCWHLGNREWTDNSQWEMQLVTLLMSAQCKEFQKNKNRGAWETTYTWGFSEMSLDSTSQTTTQSALWEILWLSGKWEQSWRCWVIFLEDGQRHCRADKINQPSS